MHENIDKIAMVAHGTIALLGGLVRALEQEYKKEQRKWFDVLVMALIAGFTGTLFGMLAMYFIGENSYFTLAIAGMGGLLGEKGLYFLTEALKRMIKANFR